MPRKPQLEALNKVATTIYFPKEVNEALRRYLFMQFNTKYYGHLSAVVTQAVCEFLERRGFKVEPQTRMEIKNVVGER